MAKEKGDWQMEEELRRKSRISKNTLLLALCWLVYTCSVIAKLNYTASITQVEEFFGVSHARAGMVSTFYFFAYGAGQIFNGLFCKKYNIKYVILVGLFLSGGANLWVGLTNRFEIIKYLWLVNGISLSVLWPCLIRLLSESLPKKDMARASIVIGTTTAAGTFIIYGLGALFAQFEVFRFSFYTAAILLPLVGLLWLCTFNRLTKKTPEELAAEAEEDEAPVSPAAQSQAKGKMSRWLLSTILLLAFFAVATNLVKDGLMTWLPSILKEKYGLPASVSILLTLFLPVLAIFGNLFANILYKKLRDFILLCGTLFAGSALLVGLVIGLLSTGQFVVTLIAFAVVNFLVGSSNSTITSIFPLQMKGKINSGMIAGVLNGCCYVGSTISSYGLGVVADIWGWNAVFYLLLGVACAVVVAAAIYTLVRLLAAKKKESKEKEKPLD